MIDIRKLKELVRLMVANELTEIDLRDSEEQVTLRRGGTGVAPVVVAPPMAAIADAAVLGHAAQTAAAGAAGARADGSPATAVDDGLVRIDSPIVGTFYAAPDPDSSPFVSAGNVVDGETVVCVIEAMKIFNEIKAECAGTIEKVMVKNGEAVEFGQALFVVRPS